MGIAAIRLDPHQHLSPEAHPEPDPEALEAAFSDRIIFLAKLPVRTATQKGPGLLRPDGLDARALRFLAQRWCAKERVRVQFGSDAVRALEMALADFSNRDFGYYLLGASTMRQEASE